MRITVILSIIAALGACKSEPDISPELAAQVEGKPELSPVTRAEAEAFGKNIATLLETCVPSELAALWRIDVTALRALKDAKIDNDVRRGVMSALTAERLWEGQCQSLKATGDMRNTFLDVREVDGTFRPVVRMLSSAGLNYTELELRRFDEGIRAVDATYYLTGEPLSKTLQRLLGSAQIAMDNGQLGDAGLMMKITEKQRSGDNAGALALIKQLPPSMRDDKAVMLMEVGLDPGDDEARYLGAIERFEKRFPGDPALDLVSVDGFFMRKQFDRLHGTLDRLQKRIDDPYLEIMHALAYVEDKQLDQAMTKVNIAIQREDTLQDAWDTKSTICLSKKDYACAVEAMKVLKDKFSLDVTEDIALQLENGSELVASDPWKAWRPDAK